MNLINYDHEHDVWQLMEKGQFFIDNPFMIKAAKDVGYSNCTKNWLKFQSCLSKKKLHLFFHLRKMRK